MAFDPKHLDALFPFHFAVDFEGRLKRSGPGFAKWFGPVEPGHFAFERIRFAAAPRDGSLIEFVERSVGTLQVLSHDRSRLRMKALVVQLSDGHFGFFGSLAANSILDLEGSGLTIADFAPHDPLLDYLVSMRLTTTALQDARELATRLRDQAADLEQARQQAEDASRAKGDFLARMSHEIRTPLNGILGLAQLLAESELETEQKAFVDTIVESGQTLLVILNDVLDYSRLGSEKMELVEQCFSLHRVLQRALALYEGAAARAGNEMVLKISEDTPDCVLGDSHRLMQVLGNLLGNAIKFTENGRIEISADLADGNVCIAIEDTGIGMDEKTRQRIFKPFTQASAEVGQRYGGTGLGLAISLQVVELMGGRMRVDSAPGRGSRFELFLPLEKAELSCLSEPARLNTSTAQTGRALVVDDAPVNLLVARGMLESIGWEVDVAEHGEAAIAMCEQTEYRVILMDMLMPGMNGPEATKIIRGAPGANRDTLIVALTANALPEHERECLEAGMDAFLSKPIRKQVLCDTLARLLEHEPVPSN